MEIKSASWLSKNYVKLLVLKKLMCQQPEVRTPGRCK